MMGWTLPCISLDNKKLGIQWALTICTENSGKNSNGTVHPGGNFPKKVIPFEVLPFSGFYQNDGNYLYHFSGWPVICFLLRQEVISFKPGPLVHYWPTTYLVFLQMVPLQPIPLLGKVSKFSAICQNFCRNLLPNVKCSVFCPVSAHFNFKLV